MPATVTFDSNVWRKIVTPDAFPKDPIANIYRDLNTYARHGQLKGYLSQSIFDLEAVPKKRRSKYFGEYEPKLESKVVDEASEGTIHMSFSIGPNSDGHPGNSHYFKKHLADALSLGFVILSAPRIGTPRSPDIGKELYGTRSDAEMRSQQNLCFDVFDFLNNLGCGIAVAKTLGDAHKRGERTWLDALDNVPDADQILVTKAIAEWADGDSVAGHISYRLDYFCTLDTAVSAGAKSVFSPANRQALEQRYGVEFVTPTELHAIIKTKV